MERLLQEDISCKIFHLGTKNSLLFFNQATGYDPVWEMQLAELVAQPQECSAPGRGGSDTCPKKNLNYGAGVIPQVMMTVFPWTHRAVESCFSGLRHKLCIFLTLPQVLASGWVFTPGQQLSEKVFLTKHPRSMTKPVQGSVCTAALPACWKGTSARMGGEKWEKIWSSKAQIPHSPSHHPAQNMMSVLFGCSEEKASWMHIILKMGKGENRHKSLSLPMGSAWSSPKQSRWEGTQRTVQLPLQRRRTAATGLL